MIDPAQEDLFRERMLSSGMAVLLEEEQVAKRTDGRPIVNGGFGVWHRKGQRAIFDLRPANMGERRFRWGHLPLGPMLSRVLLGPREGLRGSGDDLENYFYQWTEAPGLLPRRAVGRKFSGGIALRYGGVHGRIYRLALRTLGMGGVKLLRCCASCS